MRSLFLEKFWTQFNAKFSQLGTGQCIEDFGNADEEYKALRTSVVLSDMSFTQRFSFEESEGLDFLDTKLSANILKLRYGKISNSFLCDEESHICAEVFTADIDDKLICVLESLNDANGNVILTDFAQDLTPKTSLLSVDGPYAWKVASAIFGTDIFNLSFMSVEKYDYKGSDVFLMRNGKTGEYGYQFLVENSNAESLAKDLLEETQKLGGKLCGTKAQELARLEGNFFNIYAEGLKVKNPLELGLQWQIDFEKESFPGAEKIFENRKNGIDKKIVAISADSKFSEEDKIFNGDDEVGSVTVAKYSPISKKWTGLALMNNQCAYSGFGFSKVPNGAEDIFTISRPSILAESLNKPMLQE